jgi:hypothetical protein
MAANLAVIFALTLHSYTAASSDSQDASTPHRSTSGILRLVQAGSTGGNVGQVDKSSSGVITEAPQSRQAKKPEPVSRSLASCKLASVWANEVSGVGHSVWTIAADGTATEQGLGGGHGHATLSGRTLSITFRTFANNGIYSVRLNEACTAGSGKTTVLGGIPAGAVYEVTFTSASK